MRILVLIARSAIWAALAAAGITSLIVWRASPEFPITGHIVITWFGIMSGLCIVPSLAMEVLVAHLRLELGDVREGERIVGPGQRK
jgi:hypothetical protein